MLNAIYQRKTNLDKKVMSISPEQQPEINAHYSWTQYAKVNLALAITFMGAMLLKPAAALSSSFQRSDIAPTDETDAVLDNSQQLIPASDEQLITFADQSIPIIHRHAKRSGFGDEFQINTYTTSAQRRPSVAGLSTGDFVVTWQSDEQDGDNYGIYGQRFSNAGIPQGGEFQANTYTTSIQSSPSVVALSTGDFVVMWASNGQDGDSYGIYGQRYSSTGVPQSSEFQINTYTTLSQIYPSVAGLSTGDFVVMWQSDGQDGDGYGIYGQCYSSTGVPQGGEFQINTYTTRHQRRASITALTTDDFVVVWEESSGQDGSKYGIYGQRFSNTGVPQGSEFQINTYTRRVIVCL